MPSELDHRAADQLRHGLRARTAEQREEGGDLDAVELSRAALFVGDLHGDQPIDHVVEQAAHDAVMRRVNEDDRLLGDLAGSDHAEVAAIRRRERLVILERRDHVLMAGEGVEVQFVVVVEGVSTRIRL